MVGGSSCDAPDRFLKELADALALLAAEPGVGVRVPHQVIPELHRYLLRVTRYHLYFVYSDDLVIVVGLWGAVRGNIPRFAERAASLEQARASFESSTQPGYVNRNGQVVVRRTDLPGTDHLQRAYELCCRHCNHHYGANGPDIFQRRCPSCQDGAPGLSLE